MMDHHETSVLILAVLVIAFQPLYPPLQVFVITRKFQTTHLIPHQLNFPQLICLTNDTFCSFPTNMIFLA